MLNIQCQSDETYGMSIECAVWRLMEFCKLLKGRKYMDPRTRYTKYIITEVFLDFLKDKPLNRITVTDICKKAKINRGSFYKYYKDVYDLMEQLQDEGIDELKSMLEKLDASSGSAVKEVLLHVLSVIKSRKSLIDAMNVNRRIGEDAFLDRMMQCVLEYIQNMISIDKKLGEDPEIIEKKIMVSQYMLGGCSNLIMNWINTGMKMDEDILVTYMLEFTNQSKEDCHVRYMNEHVM